MIIFYYAANVLPDVKMKIINDHHESKYFALWSETNLERVMPAKG